MILGKAGNGFIVGSGLSRGNSGHNFSRLTTGPMTSKRQIETFDKQTNYYSVFNSDVELQHRESIYLTEYKKSLGFIRTNGRQLLP